MKKRTQRWLLGGLVGSMLLPLATATAAAAAAAEGTSKMSMTSQDLIRQNPETWVRLGDATRDGLLADRRKGWERALIIDYLEDGDTTWFVHQGDLTVPSTLINGHALIVLGHLTINGSYDDYNFESYTGQLIVMGDLEVDHVASWGALHVDGALRSSGLVCTVYNDYVFEVVGPLNARMLVVDDKMSAYKDANVEVELHSEQGAEEETAEKAVRMLHPALVEVESLDDGEVYELGVSFEQMQKHISAGLPMFRNPPAGPDLVDKIAAILDASTPAKQLDALIVEDLLLTRIAAFWRQDLSRSTIEAMIAAGQPSVLEQLAYSNDAVPKKLRKRAEKALEALD